MRTKAIVIINPNNPTGALYPREILEEIVKIAREHELIIFSDEIYDRLVMDGLEHISIASHCANRCILCYLQRTVQISYGSRLPDRLDDSERRKRTGEGVYRRIRRCFPICDSVLMCRRRLLYRLRWAGIRA
ncbi:MAG: aminotransferase class I/II-fold pyridoxal phosphate-dependent enzyme [Lachnospiraceae bacterium]